MTNWAGAVETFGKGLFAVGMKMADREDDEIAFMRQKALQELGIQAQKDLQAQNQQFLKDQAKAGQEHDYTMFGMNAAARMGELQAGQAHTEAMARREETFRTGLEGQRQRFETDLAKLKSAEEARQRTEYQITSINKDIQDLRVARQKASDDGAGPESLATYDGWIESLMSQAEVVRATGIATERRLSGIEPVPYPGKQPGPTKEAAAAASATAQTAPTAKTGAPPAGAYTGGQAAPPEETGGSLFDSVLRPKPGTFWAGGAPELNRHIANSVGGALTSDASQTGRINRQIAAKLRGMTLEEYEAELARQGQ